MKKLVVLFCILFCQFVSSANASETIPFIFRDGIEFGMTMNEVINCEEGKPAKNQNNTLIYTNQKSAGKDSGSMYYFDDNGKLYSIYVIYDEEHTNDNLYIADFESIDASLEKKYGNSAIDRYYKWSNSLYKDDKENYGFALSIGYLGIYSLWYLSDVKITHMLIGDNFNINHVIEYVPHEYTETKNLEGI